MNLHQYKLLFILPLFIGGGFISSECNANPLGGLGLTSSITKDRACNYLIRVKSQVEGIGSTNITNGQVVSHGRGTSSYEDVAKKSARNRAAEKARACFLAARGSRGIPSECQTRNNLQGTTDSAMKSYNIRNLKAKAEAELCTIAGQNGKGPTIRSYSIYAMVQGRGDVRTECRIGPGNYLNLISGTNLRCSSERYTGTTNWYDASSVEIKNRVKNFCNTNQRTQKWRVTRFDVNRNNGKMRAAFTCN